MPSIASGSSVTKQKKERMDAEGRVTISATHPKGECPVKW